MSAVVTLENTALDVDPGSSREAVIRVRNTGQIVDRFTIEILGDAAAWATVSPAAVSLFPGAEETARVTFAPPPGSSPRAGRVVFGVRVRSSENPAESVVEEGSVTVKPMTAASAAMVPQTSRGSRGGRHEVTVTNGGNVPIEVAVQPADPDRLLSFDVRPPSLGLEPGTSESVRLAVRPNETFYLGPAQSKPFGVTIVSSGQAPFELRGSILQRALLPSWLPKAAAAVAVLALASGVMAATVLRPTPAPSPTPVATPTPLAQASTPPPTASALASASAPSSGAASPSPTPLPKFALEPITTDAVTNNFELVCKDTACKADAINGMRFLAANLQAEYLGGGLIDSTTPFGPTQVPVVLKADLPFPWKQRDATGTTNRFVIDFAPVVFNSGDAYAVLKDDTGLPHRAALPKDFALQLFNRLYQSKGMVVPTFAPIDWTTIKVQVNLPINQVLVLPTPTPTP